jgi:large subunit ribosomal protein L6
MSRIGKKAIVIPAKVSVDIKDGVVAVKGPKGELQTRIAKGISFTASSAEVTVQRDSDEPAIRANHGLMRALVANMVTGVTQGFEKRLEIQGVGFKAEVKGSSVLFNLGFSHPITYPFPAGIQIGVEAGTKLVVKGVDKELVGQVASELRGLRPPDSYKGKGVRYAGETVRLKAGKTKTK